MVQNDNTSAAFSRADSAAWEWAATLAVAAAWLLLTSCSREEGEPMPADSDSAAVSLRLGAEDGGRWEADTIEYLPR